MIDTATKLSMLQERFKSKAEQQYAKALNDALSNIVEKIRTTENDAMRKRLIVIRSLITKELGAINNEVIPAIQEDMQGFAEISHKAMFTAINTSSGVGYAFAALPASTIKEIIDMKSIRLVGDKGYTIEDMFNTTETAIIDKYKQIINAGLAGNVGYREISRNLEKANETGMKNIKAIVHTSISSARDIADGHFYESHSDIFSGWESNAVLDNKTSLLCASMDGVKYIKGEVDKYGNIITDFWSIKNRPPRHLNCRSKLLGINIFSDGSGTRASNASLEPRFKRGMTKDEKKTYLAELKIFNNKQMGQISEKIKFPEWFNKQSSTFQLQYLGRSRYDLYKSGRFTISSFIDVKDGTRFTLDELKEMV